MIRKIIHIDKEKCNGCGLCAAACHESAIKMAAGKALLLRDDYCDGLGECLPICPVNAIAFVEREAAAYDEAAVLEQKKLREQQEQPLLPQRGCLSSRSYLIQQGENKKCSPDAAVSSQLRQWPVQLKLAPVQAPYFADAALLIAADCSAYAYGNFHEEMMRGKVTLIGCPKLDDGDYGDKLADILRQNAFKSLEVVRMEVPCCGGLAQAVISALKRSGKSIPCRVTTISTDGRMLRNR